MDEAARNRDAGPAEAWTPDAHDIAEAESRKASGGLVMTHEAFMAALKADDAQADTTES
ncbi:hypothetical protein [Streptomyces sp. Mg1]|uniref:hypothetical protein n=1 Tax=Streptomyces sp. Mg1 TaxID=465541 RepID=UPI00017E7FAA|nr:hypothetical protein [Streptomyces sp. Mg1]EDX21904.1 hypothetical protein SSAG_01695 [Streptomyces sp. Mg1]